MSERGIPKGRDTQHDRELYDRERFERVTEFSTWNDYVEFLREALPYYLDRCEKLEAEHMELQALVDKLHEHCKTARGLLREMLTTGDPGRCAGCGSCTTRSKCPWLSVYHRALEFLGTGV